MIIVTENRQIKVSSSLQKLEVDDKLIFKNKYGVRRLVVRKDKIVARGNGIDNEHDNIEVLE